jgi:PTH1 family peptidyl-tRNA hydrolase
MKFLIAGLGNIGAEYANTRHNIGFEILDALASASGIFFDQQRHAFVTELRHKGRTYLLIKPTTYMNLSGKAVHYWMQEEKIPIERTLVITDDLALPFGKIRIKGKGSDGGHNGLKHIQATLGTPVYPRLRFGVGDNFPKGRQVDYVLGQWTAEEQQALTERVNLAVEAVLSFGAIGIQRTMNAFNNK